MMDKQRPRMRHQGITLSHVNTGFGIPATNMPTKPTAAQFVQAAMTFDRNEDSDPGYRDSQPLRRHDLVLRQLPRQESVIAKHIFTFQWQLKSVGNASHIEASTEPPERGHGFGRTEILFECPVVFSGQRPWSFAEFPCVGVGSLFFRRKRGPVVAGQLAGSFGDCLLIKAGNFQQHFTVSHAVVAFDGTGLNPEEALFEDPIPRKFGPHSARRDTPGNLQFRGIAVSHQAPHNPRGSGGHGRRKFPLHFIPSRNRQSWLPVALLLKSCLQFIE